MRGGSKLLRAAWRPRTCLPRASFLSQLPRRTIVSAAELQFGQPLHETHPHLIAPGDREAAPSTLSQEASDRPRSDPRYIRT